jgi:chaperone BCS1
MFEFAVSFIKEQLATNDLFKGGLLLMVGGALLAIVRGWPSRIWGFVRRQSMIVIDIPDKDPAFQWVNLWLSEHNYSRKRARLLTIKTERLDREHSKPNIIFSPAPGTHYLWYKRRLIILTRERQEGESSGGAAGGGGRDPFREYFTIRILGRDRSAATMLISEAYEVAHPHTIDKLTIHRVRHYGDWFTNAWIPRRPLESVILPKTLADEIVKDLRTFFDSEEWYLKRGLPYRRGYMLYGPPGNGKTSAIMALASEFDLDIGILNLGADLSDDDLAEALANAPKNTVILLEDIDCVTDGRNTKDDSRVTFSGLLNALDGLGSSHGQIVFMTTNHIERLDPALIRPGRCDMQVEFTDADEGQLCRMFDRFFPESEDSGQFAGNNAGGTISMAEVQQHLMLHRDDAHSAIHSPIRQETHEQET